MLHHRPTSADMWDHCTGAPRRPAFKRRRPHHTRRQLLLTRRLLTTGCTSSRHAGLLHHWTRLSRHAGLPPPAAPLKPC
uniref:Uncharacterized protein n=1 Tax=Oryza meridionalis TaxID=40149 RepID=A0A0E0EPH5_9ORYZ